MSPPSFQCQAKGYEDIRALSNMLVKEENRKWEVDVLVFIVFGVIECCVQNGEESARNWATPPCHLTTDGVIIYDSLLGRRVCVLSNALALRQLCKG
jgi:hypothetical protein